MAKKIDNIFSGILYFFYYRFTTYMVLYEKLSFPADGTQFVVKFCASELRGVREDNVSLDASHLKTSLPNVVRLMG